MARVLALDVTDAGVLGVAEGGALVGPSPGYALVEPDGILVGEEAVRRARLRPRFVMSRFWERLDGTPLGRPFPERLTSADLVHAHLRDLWGRLGGGAGEVILAVPGVHGSEALGRLLGIAQALEIPVVGLVDTAVATAAAGFPGERLLLVETHLHRATVTEMRQAQEVIRERVSTIDRWGVDEVHEALARRVSERFVQKTRFDPLHSAETEQVLHDRLPGWLEDLHQEDRALLTLAVGDREHEIEVKRSEVEDWARTFAEELAQRVSLLRRPGEATTLLVSARAARLPGLVGRLSAMRGTEIALVAKQAAAAGALREREALRAQSGELLYVTRLARREPDPEDASLGGAILRPPPIESTPPPAGVAGCPTHVLLGTLARSLGPEPLVVGTAPPADARGLRLEGETAGISRAHCRLFEVGGEVVLEDLSTYGTFVNGERIVERAVVSPGDRLHIGSPGQELLLVRAED